MKKTFLILWWPGTSGYKNTIPVSAPNAFVRLCWSKIYTLVSYVCLVLEDDQECVSEFLFTTDVDFLIKSEWQCPWRSCAFILKCFFSYDILVHSTSLSAVKRVCAFSLLLKSRNKMLTLIPRDALVRFDFLKHFFLRHVCLV